VVIGASAGGFQPLMNMIGALPADFPGAVFIVLHLSPTVPSFLAELLNRASEMTCQQAVQGERFQVGYVYVAPPDFHLTIEDGLTVLTSTKRVKHVRPSIDVLFKSAAEGHGVQVTGIILSGLLDDGSAGSRAIQDHGGLVLVQRPEEAEYPAMPRNALSVVPVSGAMTPKEIDGFLLHLTQPHVGGARRREAVSTSRTVLVVIVNDDYAFL